MPRYKNVTSVAYRDFLLFTSLFLLLGTLAASAARCVFIFPPYLQTADIVSEDKAGALDFFALPAAAAGICVFLAGGKDRIITGKNGAALAVCGLTVPCGALALRLDDAYYACNYVPPAIIFAASAATVITARGIIARCSHVPNSKRRLAAAIVCAVPISAMAVVTAIAGYSGHKLFATLLYLYLPVPFCAAAALAASAIKPARTATAVLCVPLSVCVFCMLRPYGFDFAFGLCAASAVVLPIIAAATAFGDFRRLKK